MKNTDLNLALFTTAGLKVWHGLKRYLIVLCIVSVLSLYAFLVFHIGTLSQVAPDETKVAEQLSKVKRLKIDQESVDKIEQLEDQSVRTQSLFKEARDNPFLDN